MLFSEYDEEKLMKMEWREAFKEGYREGYREGLKEGYEMAATRLIMDGEHSVSFIARISHLSEDAVRKLARTMGKTLA